MLHYAQLVLALFVFLTLGGSLVSALYQQFQSQSVNDLIYF